MIDLDHVTWTYPHAERAALHELSLRIEPGQFVVLCGASGSGKSTALRLMNGLIPHFHEGGALRGAVTVRGVVTETAELDALGRITGTVLQHPRRQFFADTAAEEVAFAMENFGVEPAQIRARVGQQLAALRAHVPLEQRLQRLSGGQQQQVAIAAATAHDPRILLLDEPSANLSADAVTRLRARLAQLKDEGVTVVIAEHRLRWLEELADRIVVMRDGAIDVEWSAAAFRAVSDEDLAREGLRGDIRVAEVPALPAAGASALDPVPVDQVAETGLVLADVRCRLGGRLVVSLDRVSFAAGEVTAIRGANGAGKSTLARILTGLQSAAGTVRLDGRRLRRRARQRASAIVMQDVQRQLFTDSVEAEIELAATDAPASHGPAPQEPAEVLSQLGLADLADRHPLALSGGQQQRLVVAAVRVAARRIVVFDEPSSGVDRRHLQSISDQIRQVAAAGAVVVLISHDEDLLALAADRQLTLAAPVDGSAEPYPRDARHGDGGSTTSVPQEERV